MKRSHGTGKKEEARKKEGKGVRGKRFSSQDLPAYHGPTREFARRENSDFLSTREEREMRSLIYRYLYIFLFPVALSLIPSFSPRSFSHVPRVKRTPGTRTSRRRVFYNTLSMAHKENSGEKKERGKTRYIKGRRTSKNSARGRRREGYVTFDRTRKHNKSSEVPRSVEGRESCFSFVLSVPLFPSFPRDEYARAARRAKASLSLRRESHGLK